MTITPTPEILELGQDEIEKFRDQHLPEALNQLVVDHFTESTLNAFRQYVLDHNDFVGKKKKFSSYITKLKNFYKTTFFNRQNMPNTFLDLYRFCDENPELAEEFRKSLADNLAEFSKTLKES